jgi:glycosidase
VHQTHPYFAAHARTPAMTDPAAQSWFNDGPAKCVCGDPDCDWGGHIETCWFGPELPDLNWRNPEVAAAGAADLVWWIGHFGFDGLRIDAVPMMPRAATRDIARLVRQNAAGVLILGEDYTGPGDEGRAEIAAYLDQQLDGLDSAFDFPLMWAARQAIAHADVTFGFDALEREVNAGAQAWAGSGAVIAHMLDNHDTTRFASESAGDAGGDPWTQAPPQSNDASVYARQLTALAFMLTLPGIPVLYYGDEIALAGAGDPDSRRVMPQMLSPLQQDLLAKVQRLGRARVCLTGERKVLFADADHEVVQRGTAVVTLARDGRPLAPPSGYRDVAGGLLWLPENDSCWERLQ